MGHAEWIAELETFSQVDQPREDIAYAIGEREFHPSECIDTGREDMAVIFRKLLVNALNAPSRINHEMMGRWICAMAMEALSDEAKDRDTSPTRMGSEFDAEPRA